MHNILSRGMFFACQNWQAPVLATIVFLYRIFYIWL